MKFTKAKSAKENKFSNDCNYSSFSPLKTESMEGVEIRQYAIHVDPNGVRTSA